ncbi:MAG: tetratricopeptide repeat protein [Deinococcales bacterium]
MLLLVFLQPLGLSFAQAAQSDLAKRIEAMQLITQQSPSDGQAWVNLGQAYLDLYYDNHFEDLLSLAYDSFWEAVRLDYRLFEGHFGLGIIEFERGDLEAALFAFSQLANLYEDRFDGHFNRAIALVNLDRPDEAVKAFETAIKEAEPEASPEELLRAYVGLASQQKLIGLNDKAVDAYGEALELKPNDPELIYLRAEALYLDGRGVEALVELTELENQYGNFEYSSLIADIYIQEGQIDYARRSLERADRIAKQAGDNKARSGVLMKLAGLESGLGRENEAAMYLQEAASIDTSAWQAFYQLGVIYLDNGQPEKAITSLQTAFKLAPQSPEVAFVLATAYDQIGRPSEAKSYAQMALALVDEASDYYFDLSFIVGRADYRLGDYQAAVDTMMPLLDLKASDAELQLWLGLGEYQLEHFDEAVQYLERATFLNPDSLDARINLGASYLASERFEDAEMVYELVIEQIGGDADTYYNLGWALLMQNKLDKAKEAWEQSASVGYQPANEALKEYF